MAQIVKLRRSSVSGQKPINSNLQLGEIALNTVDGKAFMSVSGSNGPTIEEFIITNTVNTGSIYLTGNVTASNFTGSFIGDGSGIYNIPSSGFTGLQLDRINSGSSEAIISPNGLNINTDTIITGSLRATSITGSIDWVNIINEPTLVSGSSQITYSGITGLPNILLSSQTSSMTVLSASFATTAAFALNVIGGGTNEASIGAYRSLNQTTPQVTWSFQHNIGQRYPIFQVFNNNGDVVIPTQIKTIDEDYSEIIFSTPQTGIVIASLGGGNGRVEQFTSSSLWIVNHNLGTEYPNVTVWDSNKRVITPNTIESITNNQIEISFSGLTSGYVSVTRGGHILTGSMQWQYISDKPIGIVSGSSQLTGSYDSRYVLSGSITQTTWDNIANKPVGIISGSIQVDITGTTGYSTFSSSIATTDLTQNNRLSSLETESGSIRSNFNSFTSSYTTVSSSIDLRLDTLENTTSSTNVNYIDFDTTPSVSPIEGRLLWNSSDGTLDLGMKGGNVTLQVGQETLYEVRNQTGIEIPNGTAVYANGVTVGSGRITVAPFTSNGIVRDINFLGLATENISNGVNGYVTHFGYTRGLDTRGTEASSIAVGDENWSVGDILYAHPTVAGKLTNQKPKHEISVAIIINRHQSSGVVFVRPTSFGHLFDNHDVDINTGSITTGDLLIYDSGDSVWKNSKSLEGNYIVTGSLIVSGSVIISGSLDLSNANIDSSRYLHTQTNSSLTWSITHNLNYDYPNVTIYDGSTNKIMLPNDIVSIDENSTEITFASPEYGYALISVGGITTATADRYLHTVSSPTGSWIIDHNFNYKYVNIDVYDNNDEQLIPQKITAVSVNRTQIDFAIPTSGNAIITTGGPKSATLFNQSGSYYNTTNNIGITGSLIVTGDVDASNFNTTSDKLIKTNLEKIEGALDKIEQINGYTFNWLESYNVDQKRQIGLLANEVHNIQPELTTERIIFLNGIEEKILLLDYSKITALLVEGIKELNDKVKKLENKRKKK